MNRKATRSMILMVILGVTCLSAAGCGKMTQEKLLEKMDEAAAGNPYTYSEMDVSLTSSYKMDVMGMNMSMDLEMSMDGKAWANVDPYASYSEISMYMNMMDQEVDANIKSYGEVTEDGKVATYTYTDLTDEWAFSDVMTLEDYTEMLKVAEKPMSERFSSITMEEEKSELNGKEVYVLHVTCSGEDMDALMGGQMDSMMSKYMGESLGSEDMDMDLSFAGMTIPAVYYVDAKTFLPIQIDMSIDDMDSFLNDAINQALDGMGETLSELGEGAEDFADEMDFAMEGTVCTMTIKNIGYGPQEIPSVPEEAKEAIAFTQALEELGGMLDDGSYVLKSGGTVLRVPMPAGWMEQSVSETDLSFSNLTGTGMLTYAVIPDIYAEAAAFELSSYYEELFTSMGMTLDKGQTEQPIATAFGDIEAEWMGMDGLLISYMTIPLDGGKLYVLAMDAGNLWGDADSALAAAMDGVRTITYDDIK